MTYEYLCTSCQHTWEVEQGIKDQHIETCPVCKKDTAKRQINCRNFILVGSGWYKSGGY
jgi:putative FmdB family regulatory protein